MKSKIWCILFLDFILTYNTLWSQGNPLGVWSSSQALPVPRQEMPLVELDGKIYVPGGLNFFGVATDVVEAFDATTESWESIAPMPERLHHFGAVAIKEKIYIIAGYTGSTFTPTNRIYEYDPQTDRWTIRSSMPTLRGALAVVALNDKIYAIGGAVIGGAAVGTNEVYDPETDQWTTLAPMPNAREHLAAAVSDSVIYVVGGRESIDGQLINTNRLEAYSPASDTWVRLADMPTARGGLAAAWLNGRIYAFGGEFFGVTSGVFEENEEYDPVTDSWRQLAPLPTPRHGMAAVTVGESIHVIGGAARAGFGVSAAHEVFTVTTSTGVRDDDIKPSTFLLHQNYPNPFSVKGTNNNPSTTIAFELAAATEMKLTIFDALGNEITTLVNQRLSAGKHEVIWNVENQPSGVYFYRLRATHSSKNESDTILTKKLILIK